MLQVQEARTKEAEAAQHVYDVELKNLDSIKEKITTLQAGGGAGNLAESSVQNIVRAFQSLASVGGEMAKPIDVLKEISKAFQAAGKEGLSFQEKIDIVTRVGGGAMSRMGASAAQMVEILSQGPKALEAFEAEATKFGLVLSQDDVAAAKAAGSAFAELEIHVAALGNKLGIFLAESGITDAVIGLDHIIKAISVTFDSWGVSIKAVVAELKKIPTPLLMGIAGALAGAPAGPVGMGVGFGVGMLAGAGVDIAHQAAENKVAEVEGGAPPPKTQTTATPSPEPTATPVLYASCVQPTQSRSQSSKPTPTPPPPLARNANLGTD